MHNEYDYEPVTDVTENTEAQPVEEDKTTIEVKVQKICVILLSKLL